MAEPTINDEPQTIKTDTTPAKKSGFPWFWVIASIVGTIAIALGATKYYFSFKAIEPWNYKIYFYSWRILHADLLMFNQTWKHIKSNRYPEKGEMADAVEKYQTQGLLFDLHPEHAPRSFKGYHTIANDNWFNDLYLKLRSKFSQLRDEPMKDDLKDGKKEIKDSEILYWVGKEYDTDLIFNIKTFEPLNEFMSKFYDFLVNIYNKKYGDGIGEEVDKNLVNDVIELCEMAKIKVEAKDVEEALKSFGTASVSVTPNFMYSRMFYLFYFYTLHVEIDLENINEKDTPEIKKLKEKEAKKSMARIKRISTAYTGLLSRVFKYDYDAEKTKGSEVSRKGAKWFGLHRAVPEDDQELIESLLKGLKEKVKQERTYTPETVTESA